MTKTTERIDKYLAHKARKEEQRSEVRRLRGEGLSRKEIAEVLGISESTVRIIT